MVVNHIYIYKKFDVFDQWKATYFKIPLFRKWNPKINWKLMQMTIKYELFKIKRKWSGQKILISKYLPGNIK